MSISHRLSFLSWSSFSDCYWVFHHSCARCCLSLCCLSLQMSLDLLLLLIGLLFCWLLLVRISPIPDLSNIPQICNWLQKFLISGIGFIEIPHIWNWLQIAGTRIMARNRFYLQWYFLGELSDSLPESFCHRPGLRLILFFNYLILSDLFPVSCIFSSLLLLLPSPKPRILENI